jgi:hypothetical protein
VTPGAPKTYPPGEPPGCLFIEKIGIGDSRFRHFGENATCIGGSIDGDEQ